MYWKDPFGSPVDHDDEGANKTYRINILLLLVKIPLGSVYEGVGFNNVSINNWAKLYAVNIYYYFLSAPTPGGWEAGLKWQ